MQLIELIWRLQGRLQRYENAMTNVSFICIINSDTIVQCSAVHSLRRTLASLNGKTGVEMLMMKDYDLQQLVTPDDFKKLSNRLLLVRNKIGVRIPSYKLIIQTRILVYSCCTLLIQCNTVQNS